MIRKFIVIILGLLGITDLSAMIKVSGVFADNMVIQRDAPVKVWGWGDKGETVTVIFNGQNQRTRTNNDGYWELQLKEMSFGGPYEMTVSGKSNEIKIKNILIGDVWVCSGQSNMEFQVKLSANAPTEIEAADYPMIRSLNVSRTVNALPQEDMTGEWEICSPSTVGNFTAVGYYYARELYRQLNIPIGIIHSSWGATGVRTWTSRKAFDMLPPAMSADYNQLALNDFGKFQKENSDNKKRFEKALANDVGMTGKWYDPETDISLWKEINLPRAWMGTELGTSLGNVWYCKKINLSEKVVGESGTISLGVIDDGDIVWINGVKVGEGYGYDKRRIYDIPEGLLKAGENTVTVRVSNSSHTGGFISEPENYYLETKGKNKFHFPLSEKWKYKKSAVSMDYGYVEIGPNIAPSLLYNAMIHPLIKFRIKGVIWYQGEHDTVRAYAYRTMFPNLINDWRRQWGYEFPFYWVSLANINSEDILPKDSPWAELREAQTMTLTLPQTGQAVIYDIGEAYNIHPANKQEVGRRLALVAINKTYGRKGTVCEGPVYQSFRKEKDTIIVSFDNAEKGLCTKNNKYGYVTGFSIAGKDRKFEWAKAYIQGDKVVVFSDRVKDPVAVRYAWSNNPGANLYNKEGLLTVPFRTDSWEECTRNK